MSRFRNGPPSGVVNRRMTRFTEGIARLNNLYLRAPLQVALFGNN